MSRSLATSPALTNGVKLGDVSGISIVDFAPFLDGSNKQGVADALLDSFKSIGLAYVVNYGMPKDGVERMFDCTKEFFALPMETKMLVPHSPPGMHARGYLPPGQDVKENFECGREDDLIHNIWPPEGVFPGFKETCLEFFWSLREVELSILRAISLGLHLDEDYLPNCHTAAANLLRLLHYPSVPIEQIEKQEIKRIGTHSDFGSITLLLQDSVGGLEVEDPHKPGKFVPATPVEGAIIVIAGDFLVRWSNNMIKSIAHRVRAPPYSEGGIAPERYSIPYFCSADLSRVVDCLPGTYSETNPKRYEPISAYQYAMDRLRALYSS